MHGGDSAGGGEYQGEHDAAPEHEEQDGGGRKDAELPCLVECECEWDRHTDDRSDRGRSGSVEECSDARVVSERVEVSGAEEHEEERGREGDQGGEEPPATPAAA